MLTATSGPVLIVPGHPSRSKRWRTISRTRTVVAVSMPIIGRERKDEILVSGAVYYLSSFPSVLSDVGDSGW